MQVIENGDVTFVDIDLDPSRLYRISASHDYWLSMGKIIEEEAKLIDGVEVFFRTKRFDGIRRHPTKTGRYRLVFRAKPMSNTSAGKLHCRGILW